MHENIEPSFRSLLGKATFLLIPHVQGHHLEGMSNKFTGILKSIGYNPAR